MVTVVTGTTRTPATPLWILAVIATAFFLRAARDLFVPIAIAAVLSFALAPAVRLLQRTGLGRLLATIVLLGVIFGGVIWGAYTLGDDIAEQSRSLPQTAHELRTRMQQSGGSLLDRMNRAAEEIRQIGDGRSTPVAAKPAPRRPASTALWSGSASVIAFAGNLVVVAFLTFFFLATASRYRPRLVAVLQPHLDDAKEASELLDQITAQIERFVVVRILTAAVVGVVTTVAIWAVGGPQPVMWGMMAGVFNAIPYFGPIIVSGGLFIVGLLDRGLGFGAELAAIALLITTLEGWVLTPPLLGRAARMHTLAVLIGLLVWSWIWSVWGTILAVPMLAVLKTVADHLPPLRAVSLLLRE